METIYNAIQEFTTAFVEVLLFLPSKMLVLHNIFVLYFIS